VKVSRSYWLGLGSGLILSAMLTMVISPYQANRSNTANTVPKQQASQPPVTEKSTDAAADNKPALQTSQVKPSQKVSSPPNVVQTERSFVIPEGSSADQIADLLLAQEFIKEKAPFLASAQQLGADSKFRAGTFTLVPGLTPEELIHRLLKN
jgi:hypothetical protein